MIKCKNCTAEIPPQWVAAINSGICPGCGGDIFNPADKELLSELRDAMQKMEPASAESIAGWLLSNYRLHKIGDAEPTEFHRPRHAHHNPNDGVPDNIKIADNPVHKFLQRTGYAKQLDNRKRLKDIVNEIDSNVSHGPPVVRSNNPAHSIYNVDYDPAIDLDTPVPGEYDDYDDYQDYQPTAPMAKHALANSVIMGGDPNVPPPTPEEMQAMMAAISMAGQAPPPEENLPPALQIERMKRLQKQHGVASGGGQGVFRRSG